MLRALRTQSDFQSAVRLQRQVWGDEFEDLVPAATLQIALEVGGIAVGAFDQGDLVGLVFGLTGPRDGEIVHWSDLLAVRPDRRGRGLAVRLKAFQRDRLLEAGIRTVHWTFDPLEAVNGRMNLSRLGAVASEYRRDLYGPSASPLHRGIGMDRLLVTWTLDSPRVVRRIGGHDPASANSRDRPPVDGHPPERLIDVAVCNEPVDCGDVPRPAEPELGLEAERVGIAVPFGIQSLKARDAVLAEEWRRTTRAAFEHYFAEGYAASEAVPVRPIGGGREASVREGEDDREGAYCVYVLERGGRSALMP